MESIAHKYKLVLLGDSGVGKSCIVRQFVEKSFSDVPLSTIGVDFLTKTLEVKGENGRNHKCKLQVWDTAGKERFRSLLSTYITGSDAIVVVYDVTKKETLDSVSSWTDMIVKHITPPPLFLVANKIDSDERLVSNAEGAAVALRLGLWYHEVSSKEFDGVSALFEKITRKILATEPAPKEKQEENTNLTLLKPFIAQATALGSKEWRRSKFSVVGEGRAGKTAFTNAVVGKKFEETASTVGINQLTCEVKEIQSGVDGDIDPGDRKWGEYQRSGREYETALAALVALEARTRMKLQAPVSELAGARGLLETGTIDGGGDYSRTPSYEKSFAENAQAENSKPAVVTNSAEDDVVPTVRLGVDLACDEEMVMKMLATMKDEESGLLISLFDFGGQAVFDVIHHLFLTRNGVYALVFNMEWLTHDGPEKDKALRFMRSWLSSIAVHTFDKTTQMTAPIVLVGTRLDLVPSPAMHEQISTLLHKQFSDNLAWRSVVENENGHDSNGKAIQCFFPIDNKLGKEGATMKQLMSVVHGAIDSATYTHEQVPLTLFKLIDQMADTEKAYLALSDVKAIGETCGVTEEDISIFLKFLHDMGHLMWHDEPELRDVVILDPVAYLVTPATIIICKLSPDNEDSTHHSMPSHRECAKLHKHEWTALKNDGILNTKLLPILWKEYADQSRVLLLLMVKFGLLVSLRSATISKSDKANAIVRFLVPTLLASAPASDPSVMHWTRDPAFSSCYFVFTLAEELESKTTLTEADLISLGFLPSGFFERLIGRALSWSQDTAKGSCIDLQSVMLHKDMAVLSFGRQRFRIVHCADIHCVRVDIEGRNPMAVQQKLLNLIIKIIDECMKSLCCFPAVSYISVASRVNDGGAKVLSGLKKGLHPTEMLIPLPQLRKAAKGESILAWRGGHTLLSVTEIKDNYGQWLQMYDLRERYDVFISYRWSDRGKPQYDSDFTEALFDVLTNFSVGEQNRAVEVFLDRKRLQDGRLFKVDFAAALCNTLVAVPVVTMEALGRMLDHAPEQVDNVLLEWIMMIECSEAKRILKVYPVMFGQRQANNALSASENSAPEGDPQEVPVRSNVTVRNFFGDFKALNIPDIVPSATLAQAEELLHANGVPLSTRFGSHTVRSVLMHLQQYLLCLASDFESNELVEAFAGKVVDLLSQCSSADLDTVLQKNAISSAGPSSAAAAASVKAQAAPLTAASGTRRLEQLSIEDLRQLLERTSLPKVATIFAENQVTGEMLSYCEQPSDLLAAEMGLTNEAIARGVMKHVNRWKEHGVE